MAWWLAGIKGLVRVSGGIVITPLQTVAGVGTAAAYVAGDALGTKSQFRADMGGNPLPRRGTIYGAKLIDPDDDTLSLTLHIFTEDFTATADNAALAISAADSLKWVTSIPFPVVTDLGSAKVAEVTGWDSPYYSPKGELWVQASTGGTPNIAVGLEPRIQLYILPFIGHE